MCQSSRSASVDSTRALSSRTATCRSPPSSMTRERDCVLWSQRAAIKTPRSPLVTSTDGLEARRHLGGQHARSLTFIRLFSPPEPGAFGRGPSDRAYASPPSSRYGSRSSPGPPRSDSPLWRSGRRSSASALTLPLAARAESPPCSRAGLRDRLSTPRCDRFPIAVWLLGGPRPFGRASGWTRPSRRDGPQGSPRVPTAPVSDSPSTSTYTSACGHAA